MSISYLEFLKKLFSTGDKLPVILADIQRIVNDVQALVTDLGLNQQGFASTAPLHFEQPHIEHEVKAMEAKLTELFETFPATVGGDGFAATEASGSFIDTVRGLFSFLQQHPELLQAILAIFQQFVPKPA